MDDLKEFDAVVLTRDHEDIPSGTFAVVMESPVNGCVLVEVSGDKERSMPAREVPVDAVRLAHDTEGVRMDEAHEYLLRVAHGEVDLDLDAARRLHEARGEHLT